MSLSERIAAYVLSLEECAAKTRRAEDRSIYEKYLADAAGMLAWSVAAGSIAELQQRAKSHERLWGHAWLQDEVYGKAAEAWSGVKEEILGAAT
jgi:hypothetical protein